MNKKLIRKMQTASGGPINYKKWDNRKITSYTIPYIKEKAIKLTNAGKATGAKLSTNLLDSIADNAYRAKLPIRKALGIAFKESTFGNPTDDKSAWNSSSKIRKLFNGKYPGTYLHINNGRTVLGQHLINYHKGDVNHEVFYEGNPDAHKSIILEAFEFYKQHPDKYNPGQKNYQLLINKRGDEAMLSPEILKWYKDWEKSKIKIFKPEPYKINTNIQDTILKFIPYSKQGGKMNILKGQNGFTTKMIEEGGMPSRSIRNNLKRIIRERLYNNVNPRGYNRPVERFINAVIFNKPTKGYHSKVNVRRPSHENSRDPIFAEYLLIDPKKRKSKEGYTLNQSKYSPSIGNENNVYYIAPTANEGRLGRELLVNRALGLDEYGKMKYKPVKIGESKNTTVLSEDLGEHTISRGYDDKGEYVSYYDKWDLAPIGKLSGKLGIDQSLGIGKPLHFYDRIYLDDYYESPVLTHSTYLPEVTIKPFSDKNKNKKAKWVGDKLVYFLSGGMLEFLKKGSGIHIKKKNRGKFTSYCGGTVTDECIRKAKASGNPTLVKRATFAANARKWKHKEGGKAFINGTSVLDSNLNAYKLVRKKVKMRLYGGLLSLYYDPNNPNSIRGVPMQVMIGRYYDEQQRLLKEKLKAQLNLIEAELKALNSQRITDYITNIGSYLINSIGKKSNKSVDNGSPASTSGTSSLLTNIGNTGYLSNNLNPMNFFGLPERGPSLSNSVAKYYDSDYWKSQL